MRREKRRQHQQNLNGIGYTHRLIHPFIYLATVFSLSLGLMPHAHAVTIIANIPPPTVNAKAWLLVDVNSRQTLGELHADQRLAPASLTKIMSTYLVFQALKEKRITMEQKVLPSESIRSVGSDQSRSFLQVGKAVSVHDLVYGMVVQSGNDASMVLAELIAGTQENFVQQMNDTAEQFGLKNTHFTNVDGIPDPNHYSSANDLAELSIRLIEEFPEYYAIFAITEFTYNGIRQTNRNRLMSIDPTIDGIKTGHTKEAGFCLIASSLREMPNGLHRRLLSVIMGAPSDRSRVQNSLSLLNYGFQSYDGLILYRANQVIVAPRLWKGRTKQVDIGVKQDAVITVPRHLSKEIKSVLEIEQPIIAPLSANTRVGRVKIMLNDQMIKEFPVVVLNDTPQGGLLKRAWDALYLILF